MNEIETIRTSIVLDVNDHIEARKNAIILGVEYRQYLAFAVCLLNNEVENGVISPKDFLHDEIAE